MRAPNSDAQQSRTASSTAAEPWTLRKVSFIPANDASAVSSPVADERTLSASTPGPARDSAAVTIGSLIHAGMGSLRTRSPAVAAAASSAFASPVSRPSRISPRWSRNPVSSSHAA